MARARRRGLARRFGRSMQAHQAITRPNADGTYNVVLVDHKGRTLTTLRRHVPYDEAIGEVRRMS